jgi:hypothetical protein
MVRTLNVNADIPASRELLITPDDVPTGPAEIVVVISPSSHSQVSTLGHLANSEFFGMWRERTDLGDGVEFAHNLRSEAWKRSA